MKENKIVLKIVLFITLIVSVLAITLFIINKKMSNTHPDTIENKENIDNPNQEDTLKPSEDNTDDSTLEESNQNDNQKNEENNTTIPNEESKQEENNPSQDNGNVNQSDKQNNQNNQFNTNNRTQPNKNGNNNEEIPICEELGISEYDYYNKPMYSYRYVTHPTMEACKIDGEKGIEVKHDSEGKIYQDYTQYGCYEVLTYSGRSLGYMLKLVK